MHRTAASQSDHCRFVPAALHHDHQPKGSSRARPAHGPVASLWLYDLHVTADLPTTSRYPSSREATGIETSAMSAALDEARLALGHGDVPVGAVVLVGDEIVARRHNERELSRDPTAHAEVLALRDAAAAIGSWRLGDATLVVTLEPCAMCAGACISARLGRLVFGAPDTKAGACGSLYNLCADPRLNHEIALIGGVAADRSAEMVEGFFQALRRA